MYEAENIAGKLLITVITTEFQGAFLHAHLPLHSLWLLNLHFISSLHAFEALGFIFHTGTHNWLSSRVQTQLSGVGPYCSLCSLVAHHIPA